MNKLHLLEFDQSFEERMRQVAPLVKDWEAVLKYFNVPFLDTILGSEKLIFCRGCKNNQSIQLSLASAMYPRWKCFCSCQNNFGGTNFVSLIGMFTDKSPKTILQEIENMFCARKVKAVPAKKGKKAVPSKKSRSVKPVRATPAKSSLAGAIFYNYEINEYYPDDQITSPVWKIFVL